MRNFLTIFSDNRFSLCIQHSPNLCVRAFTLLSDHVFHRFPLLVDHSFSMSDYRKLILSTFHVSDTNQNDRYRSIPQVPTFDRPRLTLMTD